MGPVVCEKASPPQPACPPPRLRQKATEHTKLWAGVRAAVGTGQRRNMSPAPPCEAAGTGEDRSVSTCEQRSRNALVFSNTSELVCVACVQSHRTRRGRCLSPFAQAHPLLGSHQSRGAFPCTLPASGGQWTRWRQTWRQLHRLHAAHGLSCGTSGLACPGVTAADCPGAPRRWTVPVQSTALRAKQGVVNQTVG